MAIPLDEGILVRLEDEQITAIGEAVADAGGGGGGGGAVTVADGDDATLGATADAAVAAGAAGTVNAHLRSISRDIGAIDDAAVSTDANGTLKAHLRGLVVLIVNFLSRFPTSLGTKTAANSLSVTTASDDLLVSSIGTTTDAAVSTDANGTVNAHLRGIVVLIVNFLSRFPASLGAKTAANSLAVTLATDDVILARLGEVQASPTANTLLDRLKALLTGIVLAAGTNIIGATKDAGPNWTSVLGVSGARVTSADILAADTAITDAPTGGQKLVITDIYISVEAAMRVDLKEETSGKVFYSFYLPASGSMVVTPRSRFKLEVADKKLMARSNAAGNVSITAQYYSEA